MSKTSGIRDNVNFTLEFTPIGNKIIGLLRTYLIPLIAYTHSYGGKIKYI